MARQIENPLRIYNALGFIDADRSGDEVFGTCIFCDRHKKLYINTVTGQFHCKVCGEKGNVWRFLSLWIDFVKETIDQDDAPWDEFSEERETPEKILRSTGFFWDGNTWYLPVRRHNGTIANILRYLYEKAKKKWRLMGLPELGTQLFGAEKLSQNPNKQIIICEGVWDYLALIQKVKKENYLPLAVPSTSSFPEAWAQLLRGRKIILGYHHDLDKIKNGRVIKGASKSAIPRAYERLKPVVDDIMVIVWPDDFSDGYDIRDFFQESGTLEGLLDLAKPISLNKNGEIVFDKEVVVKRTKWTAKNRPLFKKDVLPTYRKWLHLTPALEDSIQLCYATVLANQMNGKPLWIYLVGPPGSAKTEILMSMMRVDGCLYRSRITAKSLVSGYKIPGTDQDPSLIPLLNGKTFILKDMTEILSFGENDKQLIFATLTGAYDGEIIDTWGNSITREYSDVRFNMLAGVTNKIYAEKTAIIGERFLRFRHTVSERDEILEKAHENEGYETQMRDELVKMACEYLNVKLSNSDIPEFPAKYKDIVKSLARLVSVFRAHVEKDPKSGVLLYRPEQEVGTRPLQQLKKMAVALALIEEEEQVNKNVLRIITKMAFDSCIGFNIDVARELWRSERPLTRKQISERTRIPTMTLDETLEGLEIFNAITSEVEFNSEEHQKIRVYHLSSEIIEQLEEIRPIIQANGRMAIGNYTKSKKKILAC